MVSNMYFIILLLLLFGGSEAWKAVPANQAMYSARRQLTFQQAETVVGDDLLPRTSIHSTYKFGWCAPGATASVFLHKSAIVHFETLESTYGKYVYIIEPKHTIRYRLQCVVLRIMVPRKYLFRRSRLPLYYCQGTAHYVMFMFIQRLEMHEFYLGQDLSMPCDWFVDFYHPQEL